MWMWGVFLGIVLFLLVLDLGVFHRKDRDISITESLAMSGFYIAIGLIFGLWIAYQMGAQSAVEYVTGYLVEKSLSLDNIFVMSLVFAFFAVPPRLQHRVLFWGILGVIFLRGIMIALGAELISEFSWVLYLFAGFLIVTGIKMLISLDDSDPDIGQNPLLRLMRRHFRVTETFHGRHFFVRLADKTGVRQIWITPLFLALVCIECVDLVFAVDSVPAVFTITRDPYLIYTSNIFAILGLRALYFALAAVIHRFYYLKYALAFVLIFIGSKVFITPMLGLEKFPPFISLGVTAALLIGGVVYSIYHTKPTEQKE